nr:MAG TPA: hypothetical protein [Bacteriophage sp.]
MSDQKNWPLTAEHISINIITLFFKRRKDGGKVRTL